MDFCFFITIKVFKIIFDKVIIFCCMSNVRGKNRGSRPTAGRSACPVSEMRKHRSAHAAKNSSIDSENRRKAGKNCSAASRHAAAFGKERKTAAQPLSGVCSQGSAGSCPAACVHSRSAAGFNSGTDCAKYAYAGTDVSRRV